MKLLLKAAITFSLLLAVTAEKRKIRTSVYASKTGDDLGLPEVELVTLIQESGSKQMETFFSRKNLPTNTRYPGRGVLIADANFTGGIPKLIDVRVTEDDGPVFKDDGVCQLAIETKFSKEPVIVKCTRQQENGSRRDYIITVAIQVLK